MPEFANAMEVFKLLNGSNCRACNETTCLAFASKVFLGQKKLGDCPHVKDDAARARHGQKRSDLGISLLWEKIRKLDYNEAARRTGGCLVGKQLSLRVLGKPLTLELDRGHFITDIHAKPWVTKPILEYVLNAKGRPLTGEWIAYRDITGGREMEGLFIRRVSSPLKRVADTHPTLFEDLARLFKGERADGLQGADIALTLYPLPLLPLTIGYWFPEEGMDSQLHLFFDASAGDNGGYDVVFRLAAGLAMMFERLADTHGF